MGAPQSTLNNDKVLCQPCKEQGQEREASQWCVECPELLCKNCYDHHKALKALRGHKVIGIFEYRIIGPYIAEMGSNCQMHPSKCIESVCITHNVPCCILCKSERHGKNCDIRLKEEILRIEDIYHPVPDLMKTAEEIQHKLSQLLSIKISEADDLDIKRKMFYENIKNERLLVDKILDEYEGELKQKFEEQVSASQHQLEETKTTLQKKQCDIIIRKEIISKLKGLSGFSKLQTFLCINKFNSENMQDKSQIEHLSESVILDSKIYDIHYKNREIRLTNGFSIKRVDRVKKESEDNENSSSTVEAEENNI